MLLRKIVLEGLLKAGKNKNITDLTTVICRNFGTSTCRNLSVSSPNKTCKFHQHSDSGLLRSYTLTASDTCIPRRSLCSKIIGDEDKNSSGLSIGNIQGKLMMSYTCKVCGTKNTESFSKQAYTEGVVVVTCRGCKGNHLIADHLGWFQGVEGKTIEEILASKGESVKRITVDGKIEMIPKDEKEH